MSWLYEDKEFTEEEIQNTMDTFDMTKEEAIDHLQQAYSDYKQFDMDEGKKEDMDKDGDIDSKDYLLKRDAAIQKAKSEMKEEELEEAYVPSNIKEFAKRKGATSLVNKVAGWAEKVGKSITGGTAIGYNYSTLILDMTYQGSEIRINTDDDTVTLYDEPVRSFGEFQRVYADGADNNLISFSALL